MITYLKCAIFNLSIYIKYKKNKPYIGVLHVLYGLLNLKNI